MPSYKPTRSAYAAGINSLNIQLSSDERPIGISAVSGSVNTSYSISFRGRVTAAGTVSLYLCDTDGNNLVLLKSASLTAGSNKTISVPGKSFTNATSLALQGKALAIKLVGNMSVSTVSTFYIITEYTSYTVTIEANEHAQTIQAKILDGSNYGLGSTISQGQSASVRAETLIKFGAIASAGYKADSYSVVPSVEVSDNTSSDNSQYPHLFYAPEYDVTISYVFSKETYRISQSSEVYDVFGTFGEYLTAQYQDTVTLDNRSFPGYTLDHYVISYTSYSGSHTGQTLTENTFTMPALYPGTDLSSTAYYTLVSHLIVWYDAVLSVSQSGRLIKATMSGYAIDNVGEEVEYWLRKGTEDVAKFYGNQAVASLTDEDYGSSIVFSVVAKSSIEAVGSSSSITCIAPVYANAGYYDGTGYLGGDTYYYNGSDWVRVEMRYYDGSQWNNVITN